MDDFNKKGLMPASVLGCAISFNVDRSQLGRLSNLPFSFGMIYLSHKGNYVTRGGENAGPKP